jgi:hypothetical protein
VGFAILAGCAGVFVPLPVSDALIASCVRSSGFPDGTQYTVEEVFRTDGLGRRVIRSPNITPEEANRINICIEAQARGNSSLPPVAGVPQSVTSVQTGSGRTDTFTYGTPPASVAPVGSGRPGQCNLQMVGGTGYRCVY